MIVKTFEGMNLDDVMKKIKATLGGDATILSTNQRKMHDKDLPFFEVKAAASVEVGSDDEVYNDGDGGLADIKHSIQKLSMQHRDLQERVAEKQDVRALETSVNQLRKIYYEYLKQQDPGYQKLPKEMSRILEHLKLIELDPLYLKELHDILSALPLSKKELKSSELQDVYSQQTIQFFENRIQVQPLLKQGTSQGGRSMHLLMGPSGSGKTAMIAKLAARAKEQGQKVLLVGFDTQRIGAIEQLKVFSKILQIKLVTIAKAEDLKGYLKKYPELGVVLIDSAGKSIRNDLELSDLKNIKKLNPGLMSHLVLSMSDKQFCNDRAIRFFSTIGIDSLMFSKIDQSFAFGDVFNLSYKWHIPLSAFSIGQKIPEHLLKATKLEIMRRMLDLGSSTTLNDGNKGD